MEFVNIYDAKTHLSKFIDKVSKDQEAIIICKNGIPVAQLTEYKPTNVKTIGLLKGQIFIADNFNDDLPNDLMKEYQ